MQVESLKVFCDLVDTTSFSLAAERNGITQSAVSQQIRALEDKFEVTFFLRGRKNFAVTPEGQVFERIARGIVDQYRTIGDELNAITGTVSGLITLAAVPSVGLYALRDTIDKFKSDNPEVSISMSYHDAETVSDMVITGTADLGIIDYSVRSKGIIVQEFATEKLVLVTPPGHDLSSKTRLKVNNLEGYDATLPPSGTPARKAIDRELRHADVKLGNVVETDELDTIKRAVEVDHTISILPESTVAREAKAGVLSTAQITGANFERPLAFVQKRTRAVTPATRTLTELLGGSKFSI